jgi:hypothetical protein
MTNSNTIEEIAQKVIYNVENKKDNFGFVITVLMVISIILTLIRITQECNKKKLKLLSSNSEKYGFYETEVKSLSLKKSWFTKMMVKKAIRKQLSKDDYKEYGYNLMNAILKTGENLTEDEIITLVEAANV